MNALSLISALLLALAALLRGSAGRGAARRLMGKRHAEQYNHAANELCLFGRRLGQKAAAHHLANVGEEPLHLLPPSPSLLCAVGGGKAKGRLRDIAPQGTTMVRWLVVPHGKIHHKL